MDNLWTLAGRWRSGGSVYKYVERDGVGEYKKMQPAIYQKSDSNSINLNKEDSELLKNFLKNRSQTMGDVLTVNRRDGSTIISSLERLIALGFVKRDWEKELELHESIVYSITSEGRHLAEKMQGQN